MWGKSISLLTKIKDNYWVISNMDSWIYRMARTWLGIQDQAVQILNLVVIGAAEEWYTQLSRITGRKSASLIAKRWPATWQVLSVPISHTLRSFKHPKCCPRAASPPVICLPIFSKAHIVLEVSKRHVHVGLREMV